MKKSFLRGLAMSELKVCESCNRLATVYAMDTIADGWGGRYCNNHIPKGFQIVDKLVSNNE
jgi:hypothetical protein